jgi:hypothetical protein
VFSTVDWLVWGSLVFMSGTVAGLALAVLAARVRRHHQERHHKHYRNDGP